MQMSLPASACLHFVKILLLLCFDFHTSYKNKHFHLLCIDKDLGIVYNDNSFPVLVFAGINPAVWELSVQEQPLVFRIFSREEKMEKKDERNLNIILKNEEDANKEEIIISFSAFMKQLKRFLIFWIVAAILAGILIPVFFAVFTADQHKNLTALVSFNYSGIEKGLAPDGSKFDVNSIKNPSVIENALTELNLPLETLENIRQGISFEGITPQDAIDRITVYKSAYDSGNIQAAEKILDTTYYPTQFRVTFNYSASMLSGNQPVEVCQKILTCCSDEFFKKYGFNQALGSAVTGMNYLAYDYPEQIDLYDSSLTTLQNYISSLASTDTTRFRSTVTGLSFADLSDSIQTIRSVDLTMLSSEILMNNVTKDKPALIDYYTNRIEVLTRESAVAQAELNGVTSAIENYQLGSVIVYGDSGQGGLQYNTNSEEYDKLFERKVNAQKTVAAKQESLKDYQKRLNMLKAQEVGTNVQTERIEEELKALDTKVKELIDKINITANEYYETVYLANAYSILVPPSSSGMTVTTSIIKASIEPTIIVEALLFVLYFGYSFCYSLVQVNRERKNKSRREDEENSEDGSGTEAAEETAAAKA